MESISKLTMEKKLKTEARDLSQKLTEMDHTKQSEQHKKIKNQIENFFNDKGFNIKNIDKVEYYNFTMYQGGLTINIEVPKQLYNHNVPSIILIKYDSKDLNIYVKTDFSNRKCNQPPKQETIANLEQVVNNLKYDIDNYTTIKCVFEVNKNNFDNISDALNYFFKD
jgi:hypothetical protein